MTAPCQHGVSLTQPCSDCGRPALLSIDTRWLREAIWIVSQHHDWANVTDTEDRTEEIGAEYERLAAQGEP